MNAHKENEETSTKKNLDNSWYGVVWWRGVLYH